MLNITTMCLRNNLGIISFTFTVIIVHIGNNLKGLAELTEKQE